MQQSPTIRLSRPQKKEPEEKVYLSSGFIMVGEEVLLPTRFV
ncbi:hypothetical protein HMPREF1869_01062 [Bacteroidales bacterium KA00251]|nr:hypothetical protein HMPREF1869_01062 [Bacteroidales bacterium KA00251]